MAEEPTAAPSVGCVVSVVGRGMGVIALDNEDGTWNVDFDDNTEADIPTAEVKFLSRAGKKTTSWYDLKRLPMTLSNPDPGTGQQESIERVLCLIDDAVAGGIPPSQIVVGGHSQGGALALAVTLRSEIPIAGCVVLSGWALPSQDLSACVSSSQSVVGGTQFMVIHGDQDSTVLPECGKSVADLLEKGGCCYGRTLTYHEIRGMGHSTRGMDSEEVHLVLKFLTQLLPPTAPSNAS